MRISEVDRAELRAARRMGALEAPWDKFLAPHYLAKFREVFPGAAVTTFIDGLRVDAALAQKEADLHPTVRRVLGAYREDVSHRIMVGWARHREFGEPAPVPLCPRHRQAMRSWDEGRWAERLAHAHERDLEAAIDRAIEVVREDERLRAIIDRFPPRSRGRQFASYHALHLLDPSLAAVGSHPGNDDNFTPSQEALLRAELEAIVPIIAREHGIGSRA